MEMNDWRAHLQSDSRQKIVNKLVDTLKRHLPVNGQEGLVELQKMAERFEEKIYTSATSQSVYLREISLKMIAIETNSMQPNQVGTSSMPPDSDNWRHTQGVEPAIEINDLRAELQPDWGAVLQPESRERIVSKIMDTLKRHLPVTGQEGLHELQKIAQRFEEKIYTAATSQSDYLRKISLKMLAMENRSQNTMANSMPPNQVGSGSNS
ncbi:hypothetical protein L6164_003391 [Bauhinia variegata]|uniref:Uncharacterized protein n=1 Tax=Bauhinia variegata TaxID=167791 RepID=A0ACB9Q0C0_BAUVA|nr:hypothetical protein L6164_003391 [Bauhinia variegata]